MPADDAPAYVALGDSISIDVYAGGPGRGGASLLARNRDDDFPEWAGRDLATRLPGLRLHLLATDGGTSASVLESQLPRLEALDVRPSVVTLTAGGNDLLGAYGHSRAARRVVRDVVRRLDTALTRLRPLLADDGVVALGTVYDPSDGTADASRVGLPPWPDVVDLLGELNDGIRSLAAAHEARVAEVHAQFLGHGLAVGDPAQPDPRPAQRELWYCSVIEPNAWGASAVRAAFWHAVVAA